MTVVHSLSRVQPWSVRILFLVSPTTAMAILALALVLSTPTGQSISNQRNPRRCPSIIMFRPCSTTRMLQVQYRRTIESQPRRLLRHPLSLRRWYRLYTSSTRTKSMLRHILGGSRSTMLAWPAERKRSSVMANQHVSGAHVSASNVPISKYHPRQRA